MVSYLESLTYEFRVCMEQNRDLQLAPMHILMSVCDEAARPTGYIPIVARRKEGHTGTRCVGLLHDVAEHVIAAVTVDYYKS